MQISEQKNAGALAMREKMRRDGVSNTAVEINVLELSKVAPYFGYIDINIDRTPPFAMFSNNDDFVAQNYFWKGKDAYEALSLKIWSRLAAVSPYTLDIGSYSGVYALAAAKSNSKSKVHAFEALDRAFIRLLINKQFNQVGNLTAHNLAVSNSDSPIELNVYSGDSVLVTGSSIVERASTRSIYARKQVGATTIDRQLDTAISGPIRLIKIDAEGAEHMVLEGAQRCLRSFAPDIVCEILPGADIPAIRKLLSTVGYRYFAIDDARSELVQINELKPSIGKGCLNILISAKTLDEISTLLNN